jgi:transcriptional regulator with XRE-family HTH domain
MSPSAIAQNLRLARERLGLKQNKAAYLAGYSVRHFRRLETEGTLDLGVLQQIADGLGVHMAMLIWPPEEWKRVAHSITPSEVKDWYNEDT